MHLNNKEQFLELEHFTNLSLWKVKKKNYFLVWFSKEATLPIEIACFCNLKSLSTCIFSTFYNKFIVNLFLFSSHIFLGGCGGGGVISQKVLRIEI